MRRTLLLVGLLASPFGSSACAPTVANRPPPTEEGGATTSAVATTTPTRSDAPSGTNVASNRPSSGTPTAANEDTPSSSGATTAAANDHAPSGSASSSATVDALCSCLTGTPGSYRFREARTGTLPSEIPEASGMVTSRFDDAIFWTHNDSGHAAELFAVHEDGTLVARMALDFVARDLEDLAAGPCSRGDQERACLYVGDFGDNDLRRASVQVHRVREPDPRGAVPMRSAVESMELVYPDGAHDTEAMVVDTSGEVWLFTKRPPHGRFRLYSAPFRPGERVTSTARGEVSLGQLGMLAGMSLFTGADLHPRCGVMVGTYYRGMLAARVDPANLGALVDAPLEAFPTGHELQNEAVAFTRDGYRFVAEGVGAVIHRFRCWPR